MGGVKVRLGRPVAISDANRASTVTALTPPVAVWTSGTSTYDPVFSLTQIAENDVVECQIDDNADFASLFDSDTNTIDAAEALSGSLTFSGITTLSGGTTYYARFRYTRGAVTSGWSNTVSKTMDASFTPASITGLVAWYDPSDLTTLKQNSDGTGAVSADGDPVGYIADKSGNGYHLIQATAGRRPTYKTSGGLHWLDFDGGDMLAGTVPTATLGGNISKTFYWAGKEDVNGGIKASYGTVGDLFAISNQSDNRTVHQWGADANQGAATTTLNVEMWTAIKNGNDVSLRVNASQVIAPTTLSAKNITNNVMAIGDFGFGTGSLDGRCYGLIVATGVSPSQASTETWLGAKAGLTI